MKEDGKGANYSDEIYSADKFRELGHSMIDMLADYLEQAQSEAPGKTIPFITPDEQYHYWAENLNKKESVHDTLEDIFNHSIKLANPRYIGHQVSTIAPITSLAGMLSDFLNNGAAIYEMGMAANGIEKVVVEFMNEQIGYGTTSNGLLTNGGTLANLTALLTARSVKAPGGIWENGHDERLALMVSEASHYCIDRAARIMGLGSKGIIKIPIDDEFKMRTDLLPSYLEEAKAKGLTVFAIVGCTCTTSTGSFDDLEEIGKFAQENDLWFHVDGAHGGAVLLSDTYKHKAAGIEYSNSITIDFHKMMLTPALVTGLFYKNGQDSYKTFSQKAEYLWATGDEQEWYNSGKRTFECTKSMMSIKVYTLLKAYGKDIFRKNVDHLFAQARLFAWLINGRDNFELLIEPEANIVNFRYKHAHALNIDAFTDKIRATILNEGTFYIVSTMINGIKYLRCTVMNPLTEEKHFVELLDYIERIGNDIVEKES